MVAISNISDAIHAGSMKGSGYWNQGRLRGPFSPLEAGFVPKSRRVDAPGDEYRVIRISSACERRR